jgi:hypothetical protein
VATAAPTPAALTTEVDYLGETYGLQQGHVLRNVTFDYLTRSASNIQSGILRQAGNYAIVFGGPENASSQAAIGHINAVAKAKGVPVVYHFDPKIDGDKLDILDPALAADPYDANFLNLWSSTTTGILGLLKNPDPAYNDSDKTYLFVFNKDHTVTAGDGSTVAAPVVAGVVSSATDLSGTAGTAYEAQVASVLEAVPGLDDWSYFDYFQTRINGVVAPTAANKITYAQVTIPDSARDGFTIQTVTYPELLHILRHEGDFPIFFGGVWCPYTSPTNNIVDSAAKAAGIAKIYQFDLRLDGATSTLSGKVALGGSLYGRLVDEHLTNLQTEASNTAVAYYPNNDRSQLQREAKNIGVPYLLQYNKDNVADGAAAPVELEWLGWRPKWEQLYHYAWYTKANVASFLANPSFRVDQLGRHVDPDVDRVDDDEPWASGSDGYSSSNEGPNSVTVALPGLKTFFDTAAANRLPAHDPWTDQPTVTPRDNYSPDPNGGCGSEGTEIDPSVDASILGQNGNPGYDVQDYEIDLNYSEPVGTASGGYSARTTVTAIATAALSTISFDFGNELIRSVAVNGAETSVYARIHDTATDTHKLVITPAAVVTSGSQFTVTVDYWSLTDTYSFAGGGAQGFAASVNSTGATAIGEPNGPRFWFPSNNTTTDRATYTVTLTSPATLVGVSVGELVSREAHGTAVSRTWRQEDPTIPYLVFASFGDYVEFASTITLTSGRTIPTWSYVDSTLYQLNQFNQASTWYYADGLEDYIRWAESRFGPYPGNTAGFVFERLDGIGYSLETVGRPIFAGVPSKVTFVHELLHQWFGNSVTIARWEDLWLNEGAASYFSNLWYEDNDPGKLAPASGLNDAYRRWFNQQTDSEFWALAPANPLNTVNLFDAAVYGRGAFALAALRAGVGDDLFFEIIRAWTSTKAGSSGSTADFIALAEQLAGPDVSEPLNEWLYRTVQPDAFPAIQAWVPEEDPGGDGGDDPSGSDKGTGGGNGGTSDDTTPGDNGPSKGGPDSGGQNGGQTVGETGGQNTGAGTTKPLDTAVDQGQPIQTGVAALASLRAPVSAVRVVSGKSVSIPLVAYAAANGARGPATLSWTASKASVATLKAGKKNGTIALSAAGTVNLKVKSFKRGVSTITIKTPEGKAWKIRVSVTGAKVKATKLAVSGAGALRVGGTAVLKAKATSARATAIVPVWKSSKPSVATIDAAGVVTAKAKGKTTITLKAGGKTAKHTISVK